MSNFTFTMIPNLILEDNTISLKAKGIYGFMLSKPANWNFTIKSMAKQLKEGIVSIGNALKELKERGYIEYQKNTNGTGEYILKVKIKNKSENKPNLQNPNQAFTKKRKPSRISNTNHISNTDCYKEKKEKTKNKISFSSFKKILLQAMKEKNLTTYKNKIEKQRTDTKKAFEDLIKSEKFKTLNSNEIFKIFNEITQKYIEHLKTKGDFAKTLDIFLTAYRENRLEELKEPKQKPLEKIALNTWKRVIEYLKETHEKPEDIKDKTLKKTIENLGGWNIFINSIEKNFNYTRRDFLKTYKALN